MPMRHTPTVHRLREVLARARALQDAQNAHVSLLNKFHKQTLRRLQVGGGRRGSKGGRGKCEPIRLEICVGGWSVFVRSRCGRWG